jgi:hypothetical protein
LGSFRNFWHGLVEKAGRHPAALGSFRNFWHGLSEKAGRRPAALGSFRNFGFERQPVTGKQAFVIQPIFVPAGAAGRDPPRVFDAQYWGKNLRDRCDDARRGDKIRSLRLIYRQKNAPRMRPRSRPSLLCAA